MFRPACLAVVLAASAAPAQLQPFKPGDAGKVPAWYAEAVQSVDATFDPPEARPGQTVTFKLVVRLNPGYHTYPLAQPEKGAKGFVNKVTFPDPGPVTFVGEAESLDVKTKADKDLGLQELGYMPGTAVYERKAVVSPKAAAGPLVVRVPAFRLNVCDKDNCFPPRTLILEPRLTVLDGPAVPVEAKYADKVK
jgi:hypothetical protein